MKMEIIKNDFRSTMKEYSEMLAKEDLTAHDVKMIASELEYFVSEYYPKMLKDLNIVETL